MTFPKKRTLSAKFEITEEELPVWEARSIIIQALVGGVDVDMRDELIIGSLKHLTGCEVNYDNLARTFKVVPKDV